MNPLFLRKNPTGSAKASPLIGFFTNFWKLADVSDSIGSATLTNNGGVTFGAGKIGNAASFVSGSSQFLSRTSFSVPNTESVTVTFWFKWSAAGGGTIISIGNLAAGILIRSSSVTAHKLDAQTDSGHVITSTLTIDDNNWHFGVFYHDFAASTNTLILDNGTPQTLSGVTHPSSASFSTLNIGRFGAAGSGLLTGSLDAIGWASGKTPNAAQISAIWNGGLGIEPPF